MLPDARRNPPLEDDSIWNNNYSLFLDFRETITRYNHLLEAIKPGPVSLLLMKAVLLCQNENHIDSIASVNLHKHPT